MTKWTIPADTEVARLRAENARLRVALAKALYAIDSIDDLNTLPADENGHQWRASDLIDQ